MGIVAVHGAEVVLRNMPGEQKHCRAYRAVLMGRYAYRYRNSSIQAAGFPEGMDFLLSGVRLSLPYLGVGPFKVGFPLPAILQRQAMLPVQALLQHPLVQTFRQQTEIFTASGLQSKTCNILNIVTKSVNDMTDAQRL